jgi:hypothetical protein
MIWDLKQLSKSSSIGELVKCCGISVIQCKEILQALMKLEQIKRKREKEVQSN